jgi:hypothetical protein
MRPDIDPRKWGPSLWIAMHSIAASFDPAEVPAEQVLAFLNSLAHLLPCSKCREHWVGLMKDLPVTEWLTDRETFFTWTLKVRDLVTHNAGGSRRPQDHNVLRARYGVPVQSPPPKTGKQERQVALAGVPPGRRQPKPVSHQPAVTASGLSTRGITSSRRLTGATASRFSTKTTQATHTAAARAVNTANHQQALAKLQQLKEKKGCKSCGRRR